MYMTKRDVIHAAFQQILAADGVIGAFSVRNLSVDHHDIRQIGTLIRRDKIAHQRTAKGVLKARAPKTRVHARRLHAFNRRIF